MCVRVCVCAVRECKCVRVCVRVQLLVWTNELSVFMCECTGVCVLCVCVCLSATVLCVCVCAGTMVCICV